MKNYLFLASLALLIGCPPGPSSSQAPKSNSGVRQATAEIEVGSDGLTVEQRNVRERLRMDNSTGSIKHLYIISAYSGQVIVYSTVRGKVTSSGKRLTPRTVAAGYVRSGDFGANPYGVGVEIGGTQYQTSEVIQDDGTYGSSIPYLYWWDSAGKYHQHYVSGGQIIHVSDQPVRTNEVIINMELSAESQPEAGSSE